MSSRNIVVVAILLVLALSLVPVPATSRANAASYPHYDLLIIAPYEFIDELEPLQRFKDASARPTILLNLSEVYANPSCSTGVDEPEKIKKCIAHYKETKGIKYVMLVGDIDKFPARYRWWGLPDQEGWAVSDLYYADLYENGTTTFDDWDGNNNGLYGEIEFEPDGTINNDNIDFLPDVAVGRIPASTEAEVTAYVNKVIAYEMATTPWQAWFKTAALYTGCWNSSDNFNKDKVGDSLENRGFTVLPREPRIRYGFWVPEPPDKAATNDDAPDDTVINDGCPSVAKYADCDDNDDGDCADAGEAAKCTNTVDDDGDTTVNDGCPQVGSVAESGDECIDPESDDCVNATDDDAADDGGSPGDWVNDGCPIEDDYAEDSGSNPCDLPGKTKNCGLAAACAITDAVDDDADTIVNDGCITKGSNPEKPDCANSTDDDGDTVANDGCPPCRAAAGIPGAGMPGTIIKDLNDGVGFANYIGHGNPGGWACLGLGTSQLGGLTNSAKLPVVFAASCDTGKFARMARAHPYVDVSGGEHCGTDKGETLDPGPYPHTALPKPAPVQDDGADHGVLCAGVFYPFDEGCIAETFLFGNPVGGSGAIAYLGERSGGQTTSVDLDKYFFQAYDTGGHKILGDMWMHMMQEYYDNLDLVNANSWPHAPENWRNGHKFDEPQKFILFGDPSLVVGGAFTETRSGDVWDDDTNGPWKSYERYRIVGDIMVPAGRTLTAQSASSVLFEAARKITAPGSDPSEGFRMNGTSDEPAWFMSLAPDPQSQHVVHGVKVAGQLRLLNGGQMKIH
jgi:hypothetical protein